MVDTNASHRSRSPENDDRLSVVSTVPGSVRSHCFMRYAAVLPAAALSSPT
jgi:hypothetical protein